MKKTYITQLLLKLPTLAHSNVKCSTATSPPTFLIYSDHSNRVLQESIHCVKAIRHPIGTHGLCVRRSTARRVAKYRDARSCPAKGVRLQQSNTTSVGTHGLCVRCSTARRVAKYRDTIRTFLQQGSRPSDTFDSSYSFDHSDSSDPL